MGRDYFKSPEGEAAYKEIGLDYPTEMYDNWYAAFQKLTKNTKEKDYKIYIGQMKRFILKSGEEFLIHDMTEERQDPLGNIKRFYRGGIGKYGRPIPHYEIKVDPEQGYEKTKVVTGVDMVEDSYSIPFTAENIDKLTKYTDGSTSYSIQKEDFRTGITITIDDFTSWRDGNPIELLRFGHRASSYEKQVLEDEKIGKFIDHVTPTAGRVYT